MRELTQTEIINVSGGVTPELVLLASVSSFGFTLGISALLETTLQTSVYILGATFGFSSLLVCC